MGQTLSMDLRARVIAAVEGGLSRRAAAERFGIGVATAIRWVRVFRTTGAIGARAKGGDVRSHRIEAHRDAILGAIASQVDITIVELVDLLAREHGLRVARSTVWRFLDRHGMTFKNNRARQRAGQARRVARGVRRGLTRSLTLILERLVFIDETGRVHEDGASARPSPAGAALPRGGAARPLEDDHLHRCPAPIGNDGADGARRTDEPQLHSAPTSATSWHRTLRHGDTGGDGQPAGPQRSPTSALLIETAGARLLYLPPYSPDFNPIENAFAKLKAILRKAAARSITDLWNAIGTAIDQFTPAECANYFTAAGYEPE